MMKLTHQICLLLASTREGLANADTWKVLTKIQVSKSILQLAATNCVYMVVHSSQKQSMHQLMRTIDGSIMKLGSTSVILIPATTTIIPS